MTSMALRNHAQEEKDSELMKNISYYSNMLEQQLLFDNMNISSTVDSTPNSNIMMTNLSHQDHGIPKNNFDVHGNKENQDSSSTISTKGIQKNHNQKSVLAGKVLKFKK